MRECKPISLKNLFPIIFILKGKKAPVSARKQSKYQYETMLTFEK